MRRRRSSSKQRRIRKLSLRPRVRANSDKETEGSCLLSLRPPPTRQKKVDQRKWHSHTYMLNYENRLWGKFSVTFKIWIVSEIQLLCTFSHIKWLSECLLLSSKGFHGQQCRSSSHELYNPARYFQCFSFSYTRQIFWRGSALLKVVFLHHANGGECWV